MVVTIIHFLYLYILKPLLFLIDPEVAHTQMVGFGETISGLKGVNTLVKFLVYNEDSLLRQKILGIDFNLPVGLAAGFDYEARLTQTLSAWGFGFQTVGTITNDAYKGNPKPMLGRLPQSKSLMVNKGFKNLGVDVLVNKLKGLDFEIPVGISVGRTNSLELKTQEESVANIISAFKKLEEAKVNNAYYELNISCPNLYGDITFYPPENLNQLLLEVDKLAIKKPIFVKMPIEKSNEEVLAMLEVISKHSPKGVIFGNLQKDRQDPALNPSEVAQFKTGNFSGKPTFKRSNELIRLAYEKYGNRFTIIGCGGIFSAEDAYEKIGLGASLLQLITGMIFEGPQLIMQINFGLAELLRKDGFTRISQAIGSKNK